MSDKNKEEKKPKGKGFFDKIKSIAFETTEENSENKEEIVPSTEGHNSKFVYSNVTQNPSIASGIPAMNGQFDERFYQGLVKVMEDNNIEGTDYLEFSRGKKAMDSIPGMAEQIKYQSTFAQLQANSSGKKIEKSYLLSTADFYIEKLDQEEKDFNLEMQKEINAEVSARNNQVQEKTNLIKEKQDQIAALNAEINGLSMEIGQTQNDAQIAQAKIDATAKNFKVTLEAFKSQILLDKQNIQNFIQ